MELRRNAGSISYAEDELKPQPKKKVEEKSSYKRSGKRVLQWLEEADAKPSSGEVGTSSKAAAAPGPKQAKADAPEGMVRIGGVLYPRAALPEDLRDIGEDEGGNDYSDYEEEGEESNSKYAKYKRGEIIRKNDILGCAEKLKCDKEFHYMTRMERIALGIREWENKTGSLRSLGRKYGVFPSIIFRWAQIKKEGAQAVIKEDSKMHLSEEEKQELGNYFGQLKKFGIEFDKEDLSQAVVNKVNDGTKPSDGWLNKFEEEFRKQFNIPAPEQIPDCVKRVESSLQKYFDTIVEKTAGVPIENILCFEEVSFTDNLKKTYNLIERSEFDKSIRMSSGISVIFSASVTTGLLPCFIVYRSDSIDDRWTKSQFIIPGTIFHALNAGRFDDTTFQKYYFSIIEPWANRLEGSKVVIGNNLIKHFNTTITDACSAADITFVSLPKEAIDVCHPMEDPMLSMIKRNWKVAVADWKQYENEFDGNLPKEHFPKLLAQTVEPFARSFGTDLRASLADCGVIPASMDRLNRRFLAVRHRLLAQQHLDQIKAAKLAKKGAQKASRKR